ncbi:GDSL-type esterase/lipase family protein [Halobacillus salinus]|uniref:SGNH hydrolase-type esterase domain-containing protein n=1 Tax=Halobacillus salinus TaxID=192814 RepID=A0A4Z0GXZ4_9BACI|nr:GDSL-type esterase/lipase family protein [Halobacillus salinus]TGB02748.1 hypothetical protein E4663_11355 [Halobacillus salinus]
MKIWRWIASVVLAITIGFFIVAAFIYSPEDAVVQPPEKSTQEEKTPSEEPDETSEPKEKEEPTETEDPTLGEGLRDVFTSVIESAKDIFIREDLHITALGDSLTEGIGDGTGEGGYVGILEKTFAENPNAGDITIDNYGKIGHRTDQLLKRLQDEEDMRESVKESDLVLITIGANDLIEVVEENITNLNYQAFVDAQQGYEERLREILRIVHEENPDASIYLIGLYNPFEGYFRNVPEVGQIAGDWNQTSRMVVNDFNRTTFIPVRDIFENTTDDLLWDEDHFHPNEKGYKRIAERVLEYIREDIEQ